MSHCEFANAFVYIQSVDDTQAKIDKIDNVISALMDSALLAAAKSGITEYMLDDGQIKIKTIYRNVDEIIKSVKDLQKVKQMYINEIQGSAVQLRDFDSNLGCW